MMMMMMMIVVIVIDIYLRMRQILYTVFVNMVRNEQLFIVFDDDYDDDHHHHHYDDEENHLQAKPPSMIGIDPSVVAPYVNLEDNDDDDDAGANDHVVPNVNLCSFGVLLWSW